MEKLKLISIIMLGSLIISNVPVFQVVKAVHTQVEAVNKEEITGNSEANKEESTDNSEVKQEAEEVASATKENEEQAVIELENEQTPPNEDSIPKEQEENVEDILWGTWGTSPWAFDIKTGVLTIKEGELESYRTSPWNRKDKARIPVLSIKKIILDVGVIAPVNGGRLFTCSPPEEDGAETSLENLTEIENLVNLDTSKTELMIEMFMGKTLLEELDLSGFNTRNTVAFTRMFMGQSTIKSIDMSNFNNRVAASADNMFGGTDSLGKLVLGNQFQFHTDAKLPAPNPSNSGKWTREDGGSDAYSPELFIVNYNVDMNLRAGTYVGDGYEQRFWGKAPYYFNGVTGELKIGSGELGTSVYSPWNRGDKFRIDESKIKKITISKGAIAPENSARLFCNNPSGGLPNLTNIEGGNNLDVSNVTDMSYMFNSNSKLVELDISNWDTSHVTNMYKMFNSLINIEKLDISNWNTGNVTNMGRMFYQNTKLVELDTSKWNTSHVTDMGSMFQKTGLLELDLSNFNTKNVTNMEVMFSESAKLKIIKFSESFDTAKVIDMHQMFSACSSLLELDISGFSTKSTTNMVSMFSNTQLSRLVLGNKFKFNGDSELGKPSGLLLTGIGTTGKWTREDGKSGVYTPVDFMKNYGTVDLLAGSYVGEKSPLWGTSPWSLDENTGILTIESGELGEATASPWNREDEYRIDARSLNKIILSGKMIAPVNSSSLFSASMNNNNHEKLNATELDGLNNLDTSKVTNMERMFFESNFKSLNLSNFNTSKVTDMSSMFGEQSELSVLDISNFDTSNVTNMDDMFNMSKVPNLSKLILGDKFKFTGTPKLQAPISVSGKWTREDGKSGTYTPVDFMKNYGTGDLKAGVYVGDSLSAEIKEMEWNNPTIGENSNLKFKIKETHGLAIESKQLSIDLSEVLHPDIMSIFPVKGIQLTAYNKAGGIDNQQIFNDNVGKILIDMALPEAGYFGVEIQGVALNNTTKGIKNNKIRVEYPNLDGGIAEVLDERYLEITNGKLEFSNIPRALSFEKTVLPWGLEKLFIGRENKDWTMEISDLRGTNLVDSEELNSARQDWDLVATADDFVDSRGRKVGQDILNIAYTSPEGETQFLALENEILLLSKNVTGDKPIENRYTTIKGDKDKGFRVYLSSSSKVERDEIYKAKINFELRQAP